MTRAFLSHETVPAKVEEAQPDYHLNFVVEVRCGVPALELLRFCRGMEAALGRERKGEDTVDRRRGCVALRSGGSGKGL